MATRPILCHLPFLIFLSLLTFNPIVSAIPTPIEQHSPNLPYTPDNPKNFIQNSHPFTPLSPPIPDRHNDLSAPPPQPPSLPHPKRFLITTLAAAGLHLILSHFDIILATAIEHAQMTTFFQDLHYKFGSETGLMLDGSIVVYYGLIKLAIRYDLNKVGMEHVAATKIAVAEALVVFVEVMVELYSSVVLLPLKCWLRVEEAGVDVWVLIQMAVEDPRMLQGFR